MKKHFLTIFALLVATGLLLSCANLPMQPAPEMVVPTFTPMDLNAKLNANKLFPKVDNFLVILDASASMGGDINYAGLNKRTFAKSLISGMNQTLPNIELNSALRTFGHGTCLPNKKTLLIQSFQKHTTEALEASLGKVSCAGGFSPMGNAVKAARGDVKPLSGRTAVIIFSDGKEIDASGVLDQTAALVRENGNRVCVSTVLIGKDPAGAELMKKMADAGGCGIAVKGDDLASPQGMADFVEKVFFRPWSDRDGDGVEDAMDKCPNTPMGLAVDKVGCTLDSDGDGVADSKDKCPNTPAGTAVDMIGCPLPVVKTPPMAKMVWTFSNVLFDFDRWNIKPPMAKLLDQVVETFKAHPDLKADIEGHTDWVGTEKYNQGLSEKRAKAVKDYMVGKDIAADRLTTMGFGETRPVATNKTKEGRAKNRRVEIKTK